MSPVIGAIIGDIVGSKFEFNNWKGKDFPFFHSACRFTDDSVMTIAIGTALLESQADPSRLRDLIVPIMQKIGLAYPYCGYGGSFRKWLKESVPQPYNSYGNGAPMRVSACGIVGKSLDEVKTLSRIVTQVSHNHPEALKTAEAVAGCVFLARSGMDKQVIYDFVRQSYYPLEFTLDAIRAEYDFDVSSQGSTPQALVAFFESRNFEDAIRNAVSIGGDTDTIAAISGSIAGEYYGIPAEMIPKAHFYLDRYLSNLVSAFTAVYPCKIAETSDVSDTPIRWNQP